MKIPNWYELILLAAAAYRLWRLLALDDIFDRPRRWFLRLGDTWEKDGDPVPDSYRAGWAEFLLCPWCLGAWLSLGWWIGFQAWPHAAVVVAVPFAISALVGAAAQALPSD